MRIRTSTPRFRHRIGSEGTTSGKRKSARRDPLPQTEDVQHLKSALGHRAAKTANNVLAVLSVMLRTAVEWGVMERIPCSIKMLPTTKSAMSFHDFDEYERLVEATRSEPRTYLAVLLGGEAGLRCGEIMALEDGRGRDQRQPHVRGH